ncbi:FKBP-type peptidyl-prolyl cis-trans isomerase [Angustibacter sp. McL0619]|uniref:FKBP-type peptidyl-prolyl cis-trans isomerase n=1 Tax=Angustibacter sp. McL0619 TaxID=3415676 RepID=UPI003CFAB864
MRSALPRIVVALALPAVLLAGCASADKPAADTSTIAAADIPAALKAVTVTGDVGKKPAVKLGQTPTILARSGVIVVKPGSGDTIKTGERVSVDYVLINATSGKEADTSFGRQPASFVADPAKLMPGLANSLIGQKVGSRVLAGVAPRDGFGVDGNSELGFTKDDGLIFVLDVKSASTPLTKATGDTVAPAAGLPTIKDGDSGPTITMVAGAKAPTTTVTQVLIKGKGPVVKSGQTVSVNYVGQIFGTNTVFDSSYKRGAAADFAVGTGQTIAGFDKGLVGQTVGSRVLLVIPPAEGYGKAGNSQAGIKGTDTLVFVIDILDAY